MKKIKVLIVEDSLMFRQILVRNVRGCGTGLRPL